MFFSSNRESMWLNRSPTKNSTEHQSSTSNKSESTDRTHRLNRTTSEHDDHQNNQHDRSTTPRTNGSSQKSNDDKADNHDRKHHVHSHHQHKAHKRHKTNHDLSINGDRYVIHADPKEISASSETDIIDSHVFIIIINLCKLNFLAVTNIRP